MPIADDVLIPLEVGVAGVLPAIAAPHLWSRCIATWPNNPAGIKIYFDGASNVSGQRGWTHCPTHDCRRYRPCHSYVDRYHFAAEQILWIEASTLEECGSHDLHLAFTPAASDVDALRSEVELKEF